jgi:hypothetical protein
VPAPRRSGRHDARAPRLRRCTTSSPRSWTGGQVERRCRGAAGGRSLRVTGLDRDPLGVRGGDRSRPRQGGQGEGPGHSKGAPREARPRVPTATAPWPAARSPARPARRPRRSPRGSPADRDGCARDRRRARQIARARLLALEHAEVAVFAGRRDPRFTRGVGAATAGEGWCTGQGRAGGDGGEDEVRGGTHDRASTLHGEQSPGRPRAPLQSRAGDAHAVGRCSACARAQGLRRVHLSPSGAPAGSSPPARPCGELPRGCLVTYRKPLRSGGFVTRSQSGIGDGRRYPPAGNQSV